MNNAPASISNSFNYHTSYFVPQYSCGAEGPPPLLSNFVFHIMTGIESIVCAAAGRILFGAAFFPVLLGAATCGILESVSVGTFNHYWTSRRTQYLRAHPADALTGSLHPKLLGLAKTVTSVAITTLALTAGATVCCALSGLSLSLGPVVGAALACALLRQFIDDVLIAQAHKRGWSLPMPRALSNGYDDGRAHVFPNVHSAIQEPTRENHLMRAGGTGDLVRAILTGLGLVGGSVLLRMTTGMSFGPLPMAICALSTGLDLGKAVIGVLKP